MSLCLFYNSHVYSNLENILIKEISVFILKFQYVRNCNQ